MRNWTRSHLLAAVLLVPAGAGAQAPAPAPVAPIRQTQGASVRPFDELRVAPSKVEGRQAQGGPDRAAVLKVAREVMQQARYCDMVTIGEGGQPQARVIDAFAPEADMTVWIATNPLSRKVAEIRKDPRVTLLYFNPNAMAYVTLIGRAALVTDPAEKAKRWKDDWAALYKEKNRGDDYLLVKITPTRLEVSAEGLGVKNDPKTWQPVVIDLK
jgi:general stress protein 26